MSNPADNPRGGALQRYPPVIVAAALVSACAQSLEFRPHDGREAFERDVATCRMLASQRLDSAGFESERFVDSENSNEAIGGSIASMVIGEREAAKAYNRCMLEQGYRP